YPLSFCCAYSLRASPRSRPRELYRECCNLWVRLIVFPHLKHVAERLPGIALLGADSGSLEIPPPDIGGGDDLAGEVVPHVPCRVLLPLVGQQVILSEAGHGDLSLIGWDSEDECPVVVRNHHEVLEGRRWDLSTVRLLIDILIVDLVLQTR